jgi:carboxyl-terminal processing protease
VDAVVLDLRRNGGGSLPEAVEMTGLFIDQGPVVQVKEIGSPAEPYEDRIPGMAWEGPLVVVTSKLSASASEILAGAIQDYRRGLVVGDETTHGKGTVQSLGDVAQKVFRGPNPPELGALKITVQQFFRPGGDSTQKRGVLADITLPSITNYMDIGEADLEHAIEFDRVDPTGFVSAKLVTPEMVARLRAASEQRIGQSAEFAKLLKRIQSYRERKARKSITLNKEKFLAEGSDSNADQDEQERLLEQLTEDDTKIRRDYYLEEVLSITRDYLKALQQDTFARVN